MHREVLKLSGDLDSDHINGDKLDNTKTNLRTATRSENMANVGLRKNNKSGYKGVWYWDQRKKYTAYINKDYRKISLGYHKKAKEAAKAYNDAATNLFGPYAYLNPL